MAKETDAGLTVWTIGHSTRSLSEFLDTLDRAAITVVGDVRRFPGSRKYPQFNQEPLAEGLAQAGVGYLPLAQLGGRRRANPDSPNTAWRNASFRSYADHMVTGEFREGLEQLLEVAAHERVAMMCSEAVWWRCHRGLIADLLKAHGHRVVHLLSAASHKEHPYTTAATVKDGRLSHATQAEEGQSPKQEEGVARNRVHATVEQPPTLLPLSCPQDFRQVRRQGLELQFECCRGRARIPGVAL